MAYADATELARILHIKQPSDAQGTAMDRVLDAATYEINDEVNGNGTIDLGTPYPALAVEVCLERAVEHWQQEESAFGIVGLGGDSIPITTSRDSWGRHAHKLQPLKDTWGIA